MPIDDDVDEGADDFIDDETDFAGEPNETRKEGKVQLVIAKRWVVVVKDLPTLLKEICERRQIPWYQRMAMKIGVCTVYISNLYRNICPLPALLKARLLPILDF